jgi:hypothetical protein
LNKEEINKDLHDDVESNAIVDIVVSYSLYTKKFIVEARKDLNDTEVLEKLLEKCDENINLNPEIALHMNKVLNDSMNDKRNKNEMEMH